MMAATDTPVVLSSDASPTPADGIISAYGFKEWSLVCEALGAGVQSLILRKGGIHEGRGGFWWRHDRFFLFPTHFHEQDAQFPWSPTGEKEQAASVPEAGLENGTHSVEYLAEVDFKHQITSWETAVRLQPFHFWTEETVRARFDYSDETGISLAFLRIYRLSRPWTFPDERKFGGCRSWLDLPAVPADLSWSPVLDDASHAGRRAAVRVILGLVE